MRPKLATIMTQASASNLTTLWHLTNHASEQHLHDHVGFYIVFRSKPFAIMHALRGRVNSEAHETSEVSRTAVFHDRGQFRFICGQNWPRS